MKSPNTLVAIPAYNEEATIGQVVLKARECIGDLDLLVVNDGSRDRTGEVLNSLNVMTATHLCNLGYGRAIQTAIKYALRHGYDALVTLDADGQHRPEDLTNLMQAFQNGNWDCLIGSRYVSTGTYPDSALGRRVGMRLFSIVTKMTTGQRVYDTTSGLKVFRKAIFEPLTRWHFVDFHAEAIVYLSRLGFKIGEVPITVEPRRHGESMYSPISHLVYPLKTLMMVLLGALEANITHRKRRA